MIRWLSVCFVTGFLLAAAPNVALAQQDAEGFEKQDVLDKTTEFFGDTTQGLAEVIEKVFGDMGKPNAYIAGDEVSAAIGIGLRYGKGTLTRKDGSTLPVFWQGPSIGFDLGGNASKMFVLVYGLRNSEDIYRRVPGVYGSYYFVAGVGVNYQTDGTVTLAPIRTGVGLRAGVNIGYLHYAPEQSWLPF
ncbi:MAG: DUF1134 domain-containing protein [Alphaproteobacteria bacterium]|nr:DUF1134 domain-containing protein [Alphaproteobacteria bacterium]